MSATATKSVKKSATLASMAAKPTESAVDAPVAAPAPEFDWNTLPPARVVVYTRNENSAVDREASTPAFIKTRVVEAYNATIGDYTDASGKTSKAGEIVWFWQECGTPERAEEFMSFARKYAGFKGWTLRSKENAQRPSEVAYVVKQKESRSRKPAAVAA